MVAEMARNASTLLIAEARSIVKCLKFRHTPKTRQLAQSCPDLAEVMTKTDVSTLSRSCLKRRNTDADALQAQITGYETQRAGCHHQLAIWHRKR